MSWLRDMRVIDFSTQIAGPYCTKLLADAGADVIKIEPSSGDPLRRWSATGAHCGESDGALFRYLNHSKRSVTAEIDSADDLIASADLVVEDFPARPLDISALRARFPHLVILSISPWGRNSPWADRPWTEFVLQAECGSVAMRGMPPGEPFQAGGRIGEWVSGTFAVVPALAAVQHARRTGQGEHIDFSMFECMSLATTNFFDLFYSLFGRPDLIMPARVLETPSIEPTKDGYVGFCTNSGQQFRDFLVMIDRPDLLEDQQLALMIGRIARWEEWNAIVQAWTRQHTTAEIIERASAFRIPVAPVCNGKTVLEQEQFRERGALAKDPTGSFLHPRPPYRINGKYPPPCRPAPAIGEHTGRIEPRRQERKHGTGARTLPLTGVKILDVTNWWAGPAATHLFAILGAEVVHVESIQKPDGMRWVGGAFHGFERWWEYSPFYLSANTNKRGLTLNLADPAGKEVFLRLVEKFDMVVENYSPRVMEQFGLDWPALRAANPRCIYVRMPAFGLDGPWRDNTGFAQTMEQITGMAWVTGHIDDQPRIQRGPCDPLAGAHAAFAMLVALEQRERTGEGQFVEVAMVEAALNVAAEQVIEYTAYDRIMQRLGNRSFGFAPQGIYPCRGNEQWLAVSVATDAQWQAFRRVLGSPQWALDPSLDTFAGRWAAHDRIDAELRRWSAERDLVATVEELVAAGVPAGAVTDPRTLSFHPLMQARGFFEQPAHPVIGQHPTPTVPFRFANVEQWLRRAAPTLGQHSEEILREYLDLSSEEIASLRVREIIGETPKGLS